MIFYDSYTCLIFGLLDLRCLITLPISYNPARFKMCLIVFLFEVFFMEVFLGESPIKCFTGKHYK